MTRYQPDLGDSDPGTALRDSMSVSVSGLHLPPAMLDRAARRNRRRNARHLLAGSVAAGAAAVVAASLVMAGPRHVTAAGHRHVTDARTRHQHAGQAAGQQPELTAQAAAVVLTRAATADADSYRLISVDTYGGYNTHVRKAWTQTTYTDLKTQQQLLVVHFAGQLTYKIADVIAGKAFQETDVYYPAHVRDSWTTSTIDNGQQVRLSSFLPLQGNRNPTAAFHRALKAAIITVVGYRKLDGRNTILIRFNGFNGVPAKYQVGPYQVWLDASTYLVVQVERRGVAGTSSPFEHVSWLQPTPHNLALLTLTPPAGFTQITYQEMAQKYLGPLS